MSKSNTTWLILNHSSALGWPKKKQVTQNNWLSYTWVNLYLKWQTKFGEFLCFFEERPPIFVFTPIFQKNTLVIRVPNIFLTYTFQIFLVCAHSRGQHSSSPDKLNDTLHDKIALPDKLHAHAIFDQIAYISAQTCLLFPKPCSHQSSNHNLQYLLNCL